MYAPVGRGRLRAATRTLAAALILAAGCARAPRPEASIEPQPAVQALRAPHGMVVSASALASHVGLEVLIEGGNAVDAAIATGFGLAVTHPSAGNIGGGGFMVIRFPAGEATAIDFREKAPLAAHPEMFLDENGEYSSEIHHDSYIAVGVPGTVAGFALAWERYGTREWARLVEPAVMLARGGFKLSPAIARTIKLALRKMEPYPASVDAYSKNGEPYVAGETLRQPDLAATLERVMEQGRDGFYRGTTARLLAEEMERQGGRITLEDLARYEAVEREPVRGTYRDYEILGMPPPSSGGTALVEMLNVLEGYDLASLGHNSVEYVHLLTEMMRRAYRDRARWLADSDFAAPPVGWLTSKEYADELRRTIDLGRATVSTPTDLDPPYESEETTHYSVVDRDGMAVSVTYTLEAGYGSGIVVPGAGFLLNNEMGDFNAKPGLTDERGLIGTEPNLARPEQRMLSSMSPTIITSAGELVAVIGTPGGRTIINSVLQVILNLVDFEMGIQEAVNVPRIHHQWLPDVLRIESDGVDSTVVRRLEALGHTVQVRGTLGRVNSIMIDPRTGDRLGAPDPRWVDAAARGHD